MNKWKVLAILFTFLSVGVIKETLRILTSSAVDIASNRASLIPMALIITGLCIFLTFRFWNKSSQQQGL